jgi:hypothetical protein
MDEHLDLNAVKQPHSNHLCFCHGRSNQPFFPIFDTSATALCGTTGISGRAAGQTEMRRKQRLLKIKIL